MLDVKYMVDADLFVLVLPAGRSAHLEAGWGAARGPLIIYMPESEPPELMYGLADRMEETLEDLAAAVGEFAKIHLE